MLNLEKLKKLYENEVIEFRRDLHMYPELSFKAVSYTHLDVYKRQGIYCIYNLYTVYTRVTVLKEGDYENNNI